MIRKRGGTRRAGPIETEDHVRSLVRDLHGLIGANALAHSVTGVSRRRAAELKAETLTAIERERQAACFIVSVTRPGVVRGFDAMDLSIGHALIAGDAAVPFRTSVEEAARYNAEAVAKVLDADFRIHGAPLVMRFDRARCHDAEPVVSVLREHRVIALHGPAYYPKYYGQLERQNQEHRAWWDSRLPTSTPIQDQLHAMKTALNERWPRPTLGWRNAAQCWNERPALDEDRDALLVEVEHRAARLQESAVHPDLAKRLAIEQALTKRGYLKISRGRYPLCE
jgi:hypothetical protein